MGWAVTATDGAYQPGMDLRAKYTLFAGAVVALANNSKPGSPLRRARSARFLARHKSFGSPGENSSEGLVMHTSGWPLPAEPTAARGCITTEKTSSPSACGR